MDDTRRPGARRERGARPRGVRDPRAVARLAPAGRGALLALTLAALLPGVLAGSRSPRATGPADGAELGRRLASGEIVVQARVVRRSGKAHLGIERVLRGGDLPPVIRVAFHGANLTRAPGTPPFDPEEGERGVWVLARYTDSRGDPVGKDLYRPVGGYTARIPIPAEGGEALTEAAAAIVRYQDRPDRGAAEAELIDWLEGKNPWLVDFALAEAARFGLADRQWIPALVARARDASPRRRAWALEAIGLALQRGRLNAPRRLLPRPSLAEQQDEQVRMCHETIVRLARSDREAAVRVAAVREIARVHPPGAERLLQAIADEDPDQEVRYEAAAALFRLRHGGGRGSRAPRER